MSDEEIASQVEQYIQKENLQQYISMNTMNEIAKCEETP